MDLYEKSLQTIELPAVLELLASKAASEGAKEAARRLRPSGDPRQVKERLAETTDAKTMMETKGSPSFSGLKDVRPSLARADMGGMLNTRELLDIAGVLFCARAAASYGSGRGECGCLKRLFFSISPNRFLEDKITQSITGEEEIADGASQELGDIRRKMRAASARVRDNLQRIISSPSYSKVLQEAIITQRNGRYVVPVRAEKKGDLPGLVHDVSSSGATLFVEPMGVVKANNELRELAAKEKAEIERILMELSADCAAARGSIDLDYTVLTELDLIFAKAELSYQLNCGEPILTENEIILKKARHPLLPKGQAVPIDVSLGGKEYDAMVITGPNTGGKTVTLKTLGLFCAMAGCGLHIPAGDGSAVPVVRNILADIGDEQSIEQSLSTFSSHMVTIVSILEACGPGTLVLLDEVGAGTDPTEGAALAVAILEYVRQTGALVAATTHYAELKVYATNTAGVMNASCEFDVQTLRPTYRLLVGIPGKSNAFAISSRLGLPDTIIEDAKQRLSAESADFERTIQRLEEQRQAMERQTEEREKARRQAEEDAKKADALRRELEVRLEKAELKARREAERILQEARAAADEAYREIDRERAMANEAADHQKINEARADMRRKLNEAESRLRRPQEPPVSNTPSRPIKAGDTVELLSAGLKADVIKVNDNGTLYLQAGIMKVTASPQEVRLVENAPKKKQAVSSGGGQTLRRASVAPELDIRGMMADEAELVVERYLDSASAARLETVTIIHGKGTGALRAAVQQLLRRNKLVKSFRLGRYGEGETGVTVVELK
ncbi:MAG: endonuclease MutS2 [Oscillospiraceae bacterium]|nr:endonuclease MutS2 [Oscillospiraceae bacterium]